MARDLNFDGMDLPREDLLLARVVVDLGLVKAADVAKAAETARGSNSGDGARPLGEVLQEMGSLHPRFIGPVMKAVSSRMAADGKPASKRTSKRTSKRPSERTSAPTGRTREAAGRKGGRKGGGEAKEDEEKQRDAEKRRENNRKIAERLATERRKIEQRREARRKEESQRLERRPEAPRPGPVDTMSKGPGLAAPRDAPSAAPAPQATPGVPPLPQIPEALQYRRPPKGDGFSVRSKADVAAAWEAHRRGEPPPKPAQPETTGASSAGPAPLDLRGVKAPEPPPEEAPADGSAGAGGLALEKPLHRRGRLVKRGSAGGGPPKKGYVPKRRRVVPSGVTGHIDVAALRDELGIGAKADEPEPEEPEFRAVPVDEKQKEVAMRAFVKRAMRGTLHVQCLESVLRRRLTRLTAGRLADEAGCREKEARRVLEDWKDAGLVTQGKDEFDMLHYQFVPAKADLETIREFMHLWNNPDWHNQLLGWVIEEESK